MRRLLAVLTHAALRFVMAFMMAAGGAALVAVVFLMWPSPAWAEWIAPIRQTALAIGFAFLAAAALAHAALPSRRELARSAADPSERSVRALPLLAVLAGLAAWQVSLLLAWWEDSWRLLEQLIAGERDPLGFWMIPAVMVSAAPAVATLALVLFILTSGAVAAARPPLAQGVLRTCMLLQSGLVIGSSLALPPIRNLAARVLALAASGPDAAVLAAMTEAVARQDGFATRLLHRFQWILAGYVLVTLVMWYWQPAHDIDDDAPARSEVKPPMPFLPAAGRPPAPAPADAASSPRSSVFGDSAYRVRLRTPWILAAFRVGHLDYTITPLPAPMSDAGFSFSGKNGVLRREPGGPPLLTVRREPGAWPFNSSYVVADGSSDVVVAIFEPAGADWNVLDVLRRPLAQVEEVDTRLGYCRYRMCVAWTEVCRFTWAMHGLGVWTAELDVEFSDDATRRLDTSLAIALAPILEAQARRLSQRMAS